MLESQAVCATQNASRYLQQLCKHFAHRVEVSFDEHEGVCVFSMGTARLMATQDALTISATAEDAENLGQTQDVIERHLLRFAFREELAPLTWHS